jgi:ketosteroid isomerase-like protein
VSRRDFEQWVDRYQAAWRTDDPEQVAALFTEDATYLTLPFREPWRGREAIVRNWLAQGDSQNQWSFEGELLATEADTGVVQGLTTYAATETSPEAVYGNIWVIRLAPDGRASSFAEWWIQRPDRA